MYSHTGVDVPWGYSPQNKQGCKKVNLTLVGTQQRQLLTYVLCNDHNQHEYEKNVHLPVVDPIGQLFPWIHRGSGQADRHIPSKRMHEQNSKTVFCNILSTFIIKTWWNIHIVHSLWQLKCSYTLHFLAWCTSFGIQCKLIRVWQKEPKWIEFWRSTSNQTWWCLTCWKMNGLDSSY